MKTTSLIIFVFSLVLISQPSYATSCEYGVQFYERGEFKRAFNIFKLGAQSKDGCAQYFLSIMYQNGYYVKQSNKKAAKYIKKSEKNGFIPTSSMENELLD